MFIKISTYQGEILKEITFRILNEFMMEMANEKNIVLSLDGEKIRRGTIISIHVFVKGK